MQNLFCENEFYLHDNKKLFNQERFFTWPLFKTEACGISEIAYVSVDRPNTDVVLEIVFKELNSKNYQSKVKSS